MTMSVANDALFDLVATYQVRRRRLKDLEADIRQARRSGGRANDAALSRTVAAAERARFEFANASLWADLKAIERVMAGQGEAA